MSHAGSHLDRQRQLQADADLARRLHTQLNSPGGSAASPKPPAPAAAAAAAASRAAVNKHRCTECSLEFAPGEQYVSINNGATHFHTRCFVCTGCRRPLQGSYVTEPGSSARYHSECQNARVRDTCFACRSAIRFADTATQALGHIYHAKCFVCAGCSKPFDHASFVQHEHQPYHAQCHRQLFHPRCDACNAPLPEQPVSAGSSRIVWSTVAFWSERYCPSHFQGAKRLRACTGCARLEPTSAAWPQLPDGRTLCLACLDTSIPDTPAANSLYVNVMAFMRRLGCALPSQPPLSLVDESALNAHHQGAHSHDAPESAPSFHTRGMCLTEYSQQYLEQSVVDARGRKVSVSVDKVGARQCNVNAILVLSGLPRLLTGLILAHECMHAYLRLSGFEERANRPDGLLPQVEEGLCQLIALLWLEQAGAELVAKAPKATAAYEQRLAAYFGHTIREERSVVYGDGFRAALDCFQRYEGRLDRVLEHVRRTAGFR